MTRYQIASCDSLNPQQELAGADNLDIKCNVCQKLVKMRNSPKQETSMLELKWVFYGMKTNFTSSKQIDCGLYRSHPIHLSVHNSCRACPPKLMN